MLVVCSEYISNLLDFTSRTSTLFADGCAVALLTRGDDDSCDLLASAEHSDATFYEVATGRWRLPENPTGEAKPRLYFSLFSDGQNKMASFVPTNVPIAMRRALEKAGLGSDDIDYFVFHQPAPFLVKAWAEGIGARPEQYQLTMGDTGVMISVSIPYTLMAGLREARSAPAIVSSWPAQPPAGVSPPRSGNGRGAGVLRHRHVEPRCPRRAVHG